jgi:hypothetical protein
MDSTPPDVSAHLSRIEEKVDAMYRSVEQTRRYLLYTLIFSVVVVVLPAIGLVFAIPALLDTIGASSTSESLEILGV